MLVDTVRNKDAKSVKQWNLLSESKMFLVVLQHLPLIDIRREVLRLLDVVHDVVHELVEVTSCHVHGHAVVERIALDVGGCGWIDRGRCDPQVECLAICTLEETSV